MDNYTTISHLTTSEIAQRNKLFRTTFGNLDWCLNIPEFSERNFNARIIIWKSVLNVQKWIFLRPDANWRWWVNYVRDYYDSVQPLSISKSSVSLNKRMMCILRDVNQQYTMDSLNSNTKRDQLWSIKCKLYFFTTKSGHMLLWRLARNCRTKLGNSIAPISWPSTIQISSVSLYKSFWAKEKSKMKQTSVKNCLNFSSQRNTSQMESTNYHHTMKIIRKIM